MPTAFVRSFAKIEFVLVAFVDMGATPTEVTAERVRLHSDAAYYRQWCGDIGAWYMHDI